MTERDIQTAILDWLRLNRVLCWRQNTGAAQIDGRYIKFGRKGISDILGVLPGGKFLAIEVKTQSGHATDEQMEFLQDVQSHGGIGIICRSLDDAIGLLAPYVRRTQHRSN